MSPNMAKTGISGLERNLEMTLEAPPVAKRSRPEAPLLPAGPAVVSASDPMSDAYNASGGVQLFLLWDMGARLVMWSTAIALTFMTFNKLAWWPAQGPIYAPATVELKWAAAIAGWVLLFNMMYLGELIFFRLVFPLPQTGVYPTNRGINILDRRGR